MKRVWVKFVRRLLTDDRREQRQIIAGDLLERSCENVQFLTNIVKGDESWVYGYVPQTKQQSSQWKGLDSPCRAGSHKDTKEITGHAETKYT